MRLYHSPTSPFVRKVVVTAHECGLADRLELITTTVNPTAPNAALAQVNPLMKLPTLVTDEGLALFESTLICQYLDSLHAGTPLLPATGPARWQILRLEAIADGVLDAGLLVRYEELVRPAEQRHAGWRDGQATKVAQGLDLLEAEAGTFPAALNLGLIAVGCALGWLEFRQPTGEIRSRRPRLFAWYDAIRQRPSFTRSVPVAA